MEPILWVITCSIFRRLSKNQQRPFYKLLALSRGDPGELSHVLHLHHSAEMKGRIPKLNIVSKTLEGLLALYNVTVGSIAAVYPQEGYRKKW